MPGRLLAVLERYVTLTPEDRIVVEEVLCEVRQAPADAELVVDGDPSTECLVLLEGQAFRHKTLPDGRRQILGFLVPGDVLDLPRLFMGVDYGVTALTACQIAPIPRGRIEDILAAHPRLARAFWRMQLVEAAIQREWMIGMGRRSAYARVAHLLCEAFLRLRNVGMTHGARCRFPVTQNHLADAAGLSGVHTNRVLQSLRQNDLIAFRARELVVLDWPGLFAAAEFDPNYLHLPAEPLQRTKVTV
ncbi:Crp/Fnr family transcriptional regulator [Phenylobacterium immobile]|uniref:Crp/Fnr family transcriptional regulator n=1 Tax=Phenylobacterium immobile TaxID=21 RepID=UPI000B84EDDB|nr:Crp/Fnr family transcriptional regulator [Phenylobacterium immobile]